MLFQAWTRWNRILAHAHSPPHVAVGRGVVAVVEGEEAGVDGNDGGKHRNVGARPKGGHDRVNDEARTVERAPAVP